MLPSRIRLTRDPLARANGTMDAPEAALDGGRPTGTRPTAWLSSSSSSLLLLRSDPQYGPSCTSAERTDCVGSVVVVVVVVSASLLAVAVEAAVARVGLRVEVAALTASVELSTTVRASS